MSRRKVLLPPQALERLHVCVSFVLGNRESSDLYSLVILCYGRDGLLSRSNFHPLFYLLFSGPSFCTTDVGQSSVH